MKHCFVRIRPVVRSAALLTLGPGSPTRDEAEEIARQVVAEWEAHEAKHLTDIATQLGYLEGATRHPRSNASIHHEGDTVVVDLPRFLLSGSIEARICIAMCTGDKSTKVWMRVGMPISDSSGRYPEGFVTEDVGSVIRSYRKIAHAGREWARTFFRGFRKAARPAGVFMRRGGSFDVITLGVNDDEVMSAMELLDDRDARVASLLESDRGQYVLRYIDLALKAATSEDESPRTRATRERVWFVSAVPLVSPQNMLEERRVLFLMVSSGDEAIAVGVGYDDSHIGDLSQRSSLRAARWIATKV